jgi:RNA polymerase sigma-70 factor, ECF subfamily
MMAYALPLGVPQQAWPLLSTMTRAVPLETATPPEMRIIKEVLAGNSQAFNQLVLMHQGLAYSIAYRILQREDLAAEAVQEAFLKAYRALGTFASGHFKNWLVRIVVNTCYDLLRAHRHPVTTSLEDLAVKPEYAESLTDPAERPEAYAERMEMRQWLERALQRLPADQRTVIVLHDIHGYQYEEIVHLLNIPMGTVKSRLARGRSRLRDLLQPVYPVYTSPRV